jgi:hypothetical protein
MPIAIKQPVRLVAKLETPHASRVEWTLQPKTPRTGFCSGSCPWPHLLCIVAAHKIMANSTTVWVCPCRPYSHPVRWECSLKMN